MRSEVSSLFFYDREPLTRRVVMFIVQTNELVNMCIS